MLRVGLSGMAATLVDLGLLWVLVQFGSVMVTLAAFLASLGGGIVNFVVNKHWSFKQSAPTTLSEVLRFAGVACGTAVLIALCIHVFAVLGGWPTLLAKACAAIFVFICWSYTAQSKFVFKS